MSTISLKHYVMWSVRCTSRWLLAPFRLLSQGLQGFGLLLATVLFIVVFTLHGLSRTSREYGNINIESTEVTEDIVQEIKTRMTPRDPDPLTFKLVGKIFANLSDDEQVSIAYEFHTYPGKLLVQRNEKKFRNMKRYVRNSQIKSDKKSIQGARKTPDNITRDGPKRKIVRKHAKQPILCVRSPHENMRLGNLLFMYASTYVLAKNTNHTLTADTELNDLKAVFKEVEFAQRSTPDDIGAIIPSKYATYEPIDLPPTDVCISGFLQSWRYFDEYTPDLREQLKFPNSIQTKVNQKMAQLLKPVADRQGVMPRDIIKIGLHIRRGDMLHRLSQDQGYQTPPIDYYFKAMLYFYILHPQAHFIIVSDEPEWCHIVFDDLHRVVTLTSSDDAVLDLAVLASCDHVIGSTGTYSWWGGWLAGGDVIMYSEPVKEASEVGQGFSHYDYFPPHWKLMK